MFNQVNDETVFNPADPGRPTAPVTSAQEFRLYTAVDNGNGAFSYTVKTPSEPVALVKFRVRYNVAGDPGAWVETENVMVSYDMPAPDAPQFLTATLLRDRMDDIPDVVKLEWVRETTNVGSGIIIYAYDFLDKKHTVYDSNGSETEARIENISRFIVQDEPPAVARPYRFSIVSTNLSGKSAETLAAAPLNITSKVKSVVPPTADEVAGAARDVDYATLKAEAFSDVVTALDALPTEGASIVNTTVDRSPP